MDKDKLQQLVTSALNQDGDAELWTERSGTVLYSDLASIRPGRVYLMGINPGGKEDKCPQAAIIQNLFALEGTNSYADQDWAETSGDSHKSSHLSNGRLRPECRTLFQQRVCSLFPMLGIEPKDVVSTNVIFARSSELATLRGSKAEWKQRCGQVHNALLGIVRPRWIITLGFGDAFASVSSFGKETEPQKPIKVNNQAVGWHRRIAIPLQAGGGDPLDVGVLGVAHPSNRGFNRAGLAGAREYPELLRAFISEHVLTT